MAALQTANQFGNITRRRSAVDAEVVEEFKYIGQKDKRMRFNTSKDPIYYVFDVIENRPVKTFAKEFVKDSVLDVISFVSKVVR